MYKKALVILLLTFLANSTYAADITPPTLVSWSLSPQVVDTSNSSATVVVNMRIVDDESGTTAPSVGASSSVAPGQNTGFASVELVSGNDLDGTWKATLTIPQGSAPGPWEVSLFPLQDKQGNSSRFFGPGEGFDNIFTVAEDGSTPPESTFVIRLEEPKNSTVYSGIGNLRGWAVSTEAIQRVEIYIDGKYAFDAPYGGSRGDIGNAYPDIPGSSSSGYSLSLGYNNLSVGPHTISAKAVTYNGESIETSSNFSVTAFHKKRIQASDTIWTSQTLLDTQ